MARANDNIAKRYPSATTTYFGDSAELSVQLLRLIANGKKTATCSSLAAYEHEGEPLPQPGDIQIVLHHDESPAMVIKILSVDCLPFSDVTADFALAEGENDSLAGWQNGHREFFARNGGFDPSMMLVCERFELIEVIDLGSQPPNRTQ